MKNMSVGLQKKPKMCADTHFAGRLASLYEHAYQPDVRNEQINCLIGFCLGGPFASIIKLIVLTLIIEVMVEWINLPIWL